jgi:endoglucanase
MLKIINTISVRESRILILSFSWIILFISSLSSQTQDNFLHLNDQNYYDTPGVNVLVFSNWYDENFSDSKISGIEIIHHGVRTATNGDVRLSSTPGQWDPIPKFIERKIDLKNNIIDASLSYPDFNFEYHIKTKAENKGILIGVHIDKPLPEILKGKAGFNLEFLPSAYFEKGYLMDGKSGIFPLYPAGPTRINDSEEIEPLPIACGRTLTLAPEDPNRRIKVSVRNGNLLLYDGRNIAQNGWFVLRNILPAGKTGKVLEWFLEINTVDNWIREPVILYSQVGYHPAQEKIAVFEFDKHDTSRHSVRLLKIAENGSSSPVMAGNLESWGSYLRYHYCTFNFSSVKIPSLYKIEYDTITTKPFRIDKDVYQDTWYQTLDVFFPVQMDHMLVNEAYRVWHGAAHLDDALQAPVNHKHFDLYAQGPTTDSPYQPGEHIPGLNIGGWFDAGDYDIRTQTHYSVILNLVQVWENFKAGRDETLIDQTNRYVDLHHPDGKPDILQQIEHGVLALIAQHKAIGHAIPGIIVPTLDQYTHLGDAITITDNLIFNTELGPSESKNGSSGKFDDRWAFTSKSTSLNFGSIAALAAASRVLRGYNDRLSDECITIAERVWEEEHSHEPDLFHHGNTTGGPLETEELRAAVELLITTKNPKYSDRIKDLWGRIESEFGWHALLAVRAIPYMDESYYVRLEKLTREYKKNIEKIKTLNPFGVPIYEGGWAGNGRIVHFALTNYLLHKMFPQIIEAEDVYRGLNYLYGCHPGSNISFVSGVGTVSKKIAYGNNRADYSFIAGGIVPGVLILKPDYPENKEDWPFLWGENEYVISLGASYIYLANAVNELLNTEIH